MSEHARNVQQVKRLRASDATALPFAHEAADRVVFMDDGVVVEEGPPSEVLRNPRTARAQQFLRQVADR